MRAFTRTGVCAVLFAAFVALATSACSSPEEASSPASTPCTSTTTAGPQGDAAISGSDLITAGWQPESVNPSSPTPGSKVLLPLINAQTSYQTGKDAVEGAARALRANGLGPAYDAQSLRGWASCLTPVATAYTVAGSDPKEDGHVVLLVVKLNGFAAFMKASRASGASLAGLAGDIAAQAPNDYNLVVKGIQSNYGAATGMTGYAS